MQIPLKVNQTYFLWNQAWPHNDHLLLKAKVQLLHHTYLWPPILWHSKAWTKEILKLWPPNFQKSLPYVCLKSIGIFVGAAWLIWMPHPFLKNCSDTFETPCICKKLRWCRWCSKKKLEVLDVVFTSTTYQSHVDFCWM